MYLDPDTLLREFLLVGVFGVGGSVAPNKCDDEFCI